MQRSEEVSFTGVIGLAEAKNALLLLAVDPTLGGIALIGPRGSGKSTLARAFGALIPGAPFVEVTPATDNAALVGGVDLGASLAAGRRVLAAGLLDRARGGIICIDACDRLDETISKRTLSAIDTGAFIVLACFDSAQPPSKAIVERLAFTIELEDDRDPAMRSDVMRANASLTTDEDREPTSALAITIKNARMRLPAVIIEPDRIAELVAVAAALGVEGQRADIFAAKAARASAALAHRLAVNDDDLRLAVRLVYGARATQLPPPSDDSSADANSDAAAEGPASGPSHEPADSSQAPGERRPSTSGEDTVLEPLTAAVPLDTLTATFARRAGARSGSRGVTIGTRRGRAVGSVPGRLRDGRLALLPTLLSAAPKQRGRVPGERFVVHSADIRIARLRDKTRTVYIFVVDASGSMAVNRMRAAKGAAGVLLGRAYVHRDHVALIAVRGNAALTLLEPCQSTERAKRSIDTLPSGGGTPLAAGLHAADEIAERAQARGFAHTVLVVISDGRGNIPMHASTGSTREAVASELRRVAESLRARKRQSIVIDTQARFVARSEARDLAGWLGGRYVFLPTLSAQGIVEVL